MNAKKSGKLNIIFFQISVETIGPAKTTLKYFKLEAFKLRSNPSYPFKMRLIYSTINSTKYNLNNFERLKSRFNFVDVTLLYRGIDYKHHCDRSKYSIRNPKRLTLWVSTIVSFFF